MNVRRIIPMALQILAGILSLAAAFYGAISIYAGHQSSVGLLLMFSIPLILLLPFFCVSFFRPRLSVALQVSAAIVFVGAIFLLNLHACATNRPCPGLLQVAMKSFLDPTALVPFMIAALQTLSIFMRDLERVPEGTRRTI
jgi:hypothetical protein